MNKIKSSHGKQIVGYTFLPSINPASVMNLMIVPGMLVCIIFRIGMCMFVVSKDFLISSTTVNVRAGRAIGLNPFSTVLFSVCSAVTVECCVLYPCCMGVFGMFAVM